GVNNVVLLGMGGSSLGAVTIDAVFPRVAGFPNLYVLDTTVPGAVAGLTRRIEVEKTLFLVSSKSGTTAEVMALFRYFWGLVH
ncbi:MAG: glucose-6-phosphate isomerase, partial [Armatimonadetes bacterium]|nr:glucose-6-phosphate isomerase [Armatimonadota bacterium]NIO97721.1 glucose-6-phosphate isomerase [Armatimonadota bacterium]